MTNLFDRFPLLKPNYESASVTNMFWIGAAAQGLRFKQDTTGFIHGMRYTAPVTLNLLEARDFGKPLANPDSEVQVCPDALTAKYLDRMNRSSALF